MEKLLIVGDSLAAGLPHLSFFSQLRKTFPSLTVIARAGGGDTLARIAARLWRLLEGERPDAVLLEAGANDVMLPTWAERGAAWRRFQRLMEWRGSVPAPDIPSFSDTYALAVDGLRQRGVEDIYVTTITPLGEDLSSGINRRREEYNAAIRDIAVRHDVRLVDAARAFEGALQEWDFPSGYLAEGFRGLLLDTFRCLTERGAWRLSGRRGLVLTIDGVHLNPLGARIFAEAIASALRADGA